MFGGWLVEREGGKPEREGARSLEGEKKEREDKWERKREQRNRERKLNLVAAMDDRGRERETLQRVLELDVENERRMSLES